jgi:hypothetical protein
MPPVRRYVWVMCWNRCWKRSTLFRHPRQIELDGGIKHVNVIIEPPHCALFTRFAMEDSRRWGEIIEMSLNLEQAGDIIERMSGDVADKFGIRAR